MKHGLRCIIILLSLASLMACKSVDARTSDRYKPGTYSANADGIGNVVVTITVDANKIVDVKLGLAGETPAIGQAAGGALKKQILSTQSDKIDGVSGATVTSTAVRAALADCLKQAERISAPVAAPADQKSQAASYKAGTYTSTQMGMAGKINITVTFSDNAIKSIDVGKNNETLMVGSEAIKILPKRIVDNQSLKVNVVSGATYSSNAVIFGVRDCVKQAGGSIDALTKVPLTADTYENYKTAPHKADIVVVGGGIAGISAAIAAVQKGGNVLLLEEKEYLGGNSVLSTGVYQLGGGTTIQKSQGIEDDADSFYKWILKNSDNAKDPMQASWIAKNSQKLIDWFASMGVNFDAKVTPTDGSTIPRTHVLTPNIGTAVITLADYMKKIGVDVRYATKVDSFILDNAGKIIGVNATDFDHAPVQYYGKEIVLATGGWAANHDMIVKTWGPSYSSLVYGGAKGMDGTMLNAATSLGAATVDMAEPHVDATLEVTKGITVTTELLKGAGGILIRQSTGQRFVDEQAKHSEVAAAFMHNLGDKYYYEIFDGKALSYSSALTTKTNAYINMGLATQYDSIDSMAKSLGVNKDALAQTIAQYNAAARGEKDDAVGRKIFSKELAAPYYAMKVSNGVAVTVGGLKVDDGMQVLDTKGNPIPNLYAVGEIVGGYLTHYVGGDSLSRSSISGMLVGQELAALNAK